MLRNVYLNSKMFPILYRKVIHGMAAMTAVLLVGVNAVQTEVPGCQMHDVC